MRLTVPTWLAVYLSLAVLGVAVVVEWLLGWFPAPRPDSRPQRPMPEVTAQTVVH
jgi:hypothetical protein